MPSHQRSETVECKYCGSPGAVKCGAYKGIPRYLCKACRHKFKDDRHVFHMGVPSVYIEYVLNQYYEGTWINDIRDGLQRDFGYNTSAALVRYWIAKYTARALQATGGYRPQTGDTWVIDEMIIRLGAKKHWLYDIVDDRTNFILAWLVAPARTDDIITRLIHTASGLTGSLPKLVMAYMPRAAFKTMQKDAGYLSEQVAWESFASRHRIGILSDDHIYRLMNLRRYRTADTAEVFLQGLSIHYNYFTRNEKLQGKTPAAAARIEYPFRDWRELVEQPVPPGS